MPSWDVTTRHNLLNKLELRLPERVLGLKNKLFSCHHHTGGSFSSSCSDILSCFFYQICNVCVCFSPWLSVPHIELGSLKQFLTELSSKWFILRLLLMIIFIINCNLMIIFLINHRSID